MVTVLSLKLIPRRVPEWYFLTRGLFKQRRALQSERKDKRMWQMRNGKRMKTGTCEPGGASKRRKRKREIGVGE